MKLDAGAVRASPTDLANFLACPHKTSLDLQVAHGTLTKPSWRDPLADALAERGAAHEQQYVDRLRAAGLTVIDLGAAGHGDQPARTLEAMRAGADVIVQAALGDDRWLGYADVLHRVAVPSDLGAWSYEAHDTKRSRETRGGTILQLCVYSELLGAIQRRPPESFRVVTPAATETYRCDDFGAFYRRTRARFLATIDAPHGGPEPYPNPVDHCDVCRWSSRCTKRRRGDDHLSFVAGLGHQQQAELASRGVRTLAALADVPLPIPFTPERGSKETYERLRDQASLQRAQRDSGQPVMKLLPIEPGFGLGMLPEPRPGDLFLDLEGDVFGRRLAQPGAAPGDETREYLFGLGRAVADPDSGETRFDYAGHWAFNDRDEHAAFDAVMAAIMSALTADPAIHIYHYGDYEASAFKRLMGRYAAREADLDQVLRGKRFVNLLAVVRRALRAGVERYSIKDLEPFHGFTRDVALDVAGDQRRLVDIALETGTEATLDAGVLRDVEGYNRDDCRSTLALRDWLERLRADQIAAGTDIPRPPLDPVEASVEISERQHRVNELRAKLLARGQAELDTASPWYLLAYLLDWHYREDKVVWWEYYRLIELPEEDLFDERAAIAGLTFVERVEAVRHKKTGKPTGSVVDRYGYPVQETEIRRGAKLKIAAGRDVGHVVASDRVRRLIDIRKGPGAADTHPSAVIAHERISPDTPAAAVFRFGEDVAANGFDAASNRAAVDLLLRHRPRVPSLTPAAGESATALAVRIIGDLDRSTLAVQGPPGSGKTFTGARMICALVRDGRRVGVTATSHKVIRNLLDAVREAATELKQTVRIGQRINAGASDEPSDVVDSAVGVMPLPDNDAALAALGGRHLDVVGGTAWLWADADAAHAVDVLFVDEAGQASLANTLAVSQAASSLVLLGDPQQLEQPQKASHPPGVGASALDHVLEAHQTMPADRGLFLPVTWRLAPSICAFTSELFYENKLQSRAGLERQHLIGTGRFDGAGLVAIDVPHEGCRNVSDEEVEVVAGLARELLAPAAAWIDADDVRQRLRRDDILIVAPYNAHVARLQERLPDLRIGTVDKFQGQEAPVVIYAMATSRPEDAPRGMEFLYSLNRLNVATSRARCVSILVASPRLYEPDCRTPRQMQLANALARYRELARVL